MYTSHLIQDVLIALAEVIAQQIHFILTLIFMQEGNKLKEYPQPTHTHTHTSTHKPKQL